MPEPAFPRRAEWVWRPRRLAAPAFAAGADRVEEEANRYVYFRLAVELPGPARSAPCHASADGRYQLFVNGRLVGRGPGRCSPLAQSLDDYDLATFLKPGRNVIAGLVHAYGRHTAWYELPDREHRRVFGCGGWFLQGEAVTRAGTVTLDTGTAWRCLEAVAWRRDVASNSLGFMEHFDARKAVVGWNEADLDDGDWPQAQVLRLPGRNFAGDVVPFARLVPRRIPPMHETMRDCARIVSVREVAESPADDLAAQIESERPQALSRCEAGDDLTGIRTGDGHAVLAVLDFGEIVAGYIHLELDGPEGAIVDLVHGEQLLPDGRVRIFGGIDGFDAVPAHRYVLREGAQAWERFEWSGLRYLQLTIRNCARPLQVRVTLRETGYPVESVGAFECSDPLLTRLWQAGATTARRCMHDGYVDCPSREQRQWMDGYVIARINHAAFGDAALAAQMLRRFEQSQQPDGLTAMAAPGDFARAGFTDIPDFCLYWILMIDDFVLHTGDTGIVEELYPAVVRALRWFGQHLDADDLLADVPHWVFIDWAELDKRGQVTALNAMFVAALQAAARLADTLKYRRDARRFRALASRIAAAANALLWDPERAVYVDARRNGQRGRRISQQANAAAIACGVAPRARFGRILDTIMDDDRLVLTRRTSQEDAAAFDEDHDVVLAQPFFMHFLHRALRLAGRPASIIDNIRARWPELLDDASATFRETWQQTPTTSLCHAWSATPTFDLSRDVLGVAPTAPGFARIRIAPAIAGLEWARGRHPTPQGPVTIDWRIEQGRFHLDLELPNGSEAACVCPPPFRWQAVDGATADRDAPTLGAGHHRLTAT